MNKLFKINEKLPTRTSTIILAGGFVLILLLWYLLTAPIGSKEMRPIVKPNYTNDSVYRASKPVVDVDSTSAICVSTAAEYQWYFQGQKVDGSQADNILLDKEGIYFVEITDANGRKFTSDTISVTMENTRIIDRMVLPAPMEVIRAYGDLYSHDSLIRNTAFSIGLNLGGYLEAILFSLLLGFFIGLIPFFRSMLSRYVDAIRYIPLTAVTGLFIAWFGIELNMKVQFLAFGIFVYLLPVVVQRIDEVEKIYLQTAYTMGANTWQTIRHVFWPSVSSRIFDDIRVLTAISWTYIIVAEMVNRDSGVGAMIFMAQRQSRLDKVFAILLVIIVIGVLQDLLFKWLDRLFFPYKYV